MEWSDRQLGMKRDISRRDFLNGVALGAAGSLVTGAGAALLAQQDGSPEQAPGYYPPALTGMRGSHAGSFEVVHELRDRRGWSGSAIDTKESYDLVIVGGGISGLSAAQFFREAVGHYVTHAPEEQLVAHVSEHGSELALLSRQVYCQSGARRFRSFTLHLTSGLFGRAVIAWVMR